MTGLPSDERFERIAAAATGADVVLLGDPTPAGHDRISAISATCSQPAGVEQWT